MQAMRHDERPGHLDHAMLREKGHQIQTLHPHDRFYLRGLLRGVGVDS